MNNEQIAISNALYAFEAMHFWANKDAERSKIYATEFELLSPILQAFLEDFS